MPKRPNAVSRPPRPSWILRPFFRSHSLAASLSPPVSVRACLQSIIGKPVSSRNWRTSAAVISAMGRSASSSKFKVQSSRLDAARFDLEHGTWNLELVFVFRRPRADKLRLLAPLAAVFLLGGSSALRADQDRLGQVPRNQLDRADAVVVAGDDQVH